MLRFSVLGSGSQGNAAILEHGPTRLLIDAGLSAKQIVSRLHQLGIDPESLAGILLTHEHGDHIRGLDVFLKQRKVPVFTTPLTREAFEHRLNRSQPDWQLFQAGQEFSVGSLRVHSFPVPHDAADPVGFRIENGCHSLAFLSDLGFATQVTKEALKNSDLVYIETNYDDELLTNDTRRPWTTKQRISSRHGHLSNTQAAELLEEVACERLQSLVIGHLSADCNREDLAAQCIRERLTRRSLNPTLHCSLQLQPTPWIALRESRGSAPRVDTTPLDQAEFGF